MNDDEDEGGDSALMVLILKMMEVVVSVASNPQKSQIFWAPIRFSVVSP